MTLLVSNRSYAQFCDAVSLIMSSASNVDFTFDTFGKYIGGITQNGVTQLKVTVANNLSSSPDCRWNLVMYVDNSSNPASPTDEWEALNSYTMTGDVPKTSILQARIRNRCNTSLTGVNFFPVTVLPGTPIYIIENNGITIPATSCMVNVNGPGSYLTRYDEYNFDIDYRVVPGLGLRSGMYQIRVKFLLAESL